MNASNFMGGSSGVPINSFVPIRSTNIKQAFGNEVFLRTGYVDTDISSYPDTYKNANASNAIATFDAINETTRVYGVKFKPDGTKMYCVDFDADTVLEYDLSVAWDVTTATYLQGFDVSNEDTIPTDIEFKPDGTKMYMTGEDNDDIFEYDLGTAWDVTTAVFLQQKNFGSTYSHAITFSPDGSNLYAGVNSIFHAKLSTPWDVSTLVLVYTAGWHTGRTGIHFNTEGTVVLTITYGRVIERFLSVPWELSTTTITGEFSIESGSGSAMSPDKTKLFVCGLNDDATVKQYDMTQTVGYIFPRTDSHSGMPLYMKIK